MYQFLKSDEAPAKMTKNNSLRKILAYSTNLMPTELLMKKGCAEPLHQHPQEQISYVLSGTFAFTCGDETKILKTGDSVYVGPDVLHNSACIEDGVILAVFSPYRPDFL